MKVYIAIAGLYSDQVVAGVYDSPERAIAANHEPGMKWLRVVETGSKLSRDSVHWENDRDWESHIRIEPFNLTTQGPLRDVDTIRTLDYSPFTSVNVTEVPVQTAGQQRDNAVDDEGAHGG